MAKCNIAEMTSRGVLRVSGADAGKFLQDIVTNDVTKAVDGKAVHAALLTPQGKILFDFFVLDRGDQFLLECDRETLPDLTKRLAFYKLRATVEFEDVSAAYKVWAAWDALPELDDAAITYVDPRFNQLGSRLIARAERDATTGCEVSTPARYHRHRIVLGVPESVLDYPLGDTFPHEADYDQLDGVDFKKGCYVGQEVVGRMQHRGTARKRIVPVKGKPPLVRGAGITAGDASIGTLGSVADDRALAMVRLDRAEKALADGHALMAGDSEIELVQPGWAKFKVPVKDGPA